ncbi:hypothetical protein PTTG_25599 [Puccinia triticina 1-1 BBBD Race 1]|uniref:Uncharacterized protein n=2 Tax=Puccinia triticina TaxID=208348 RepID=A0A180H1Z1_PUCT1|nr:uncharacterized protein PtA15_11A658 [Puccinia triticina]OAV98608.1 hypothetical protein PTTG_25599 [Puccinia triticina 1-1 BBBD Race 1]WAQ89966.1 hypothetical protein PtA15_11A658 [Puccinia triticina]
MPSEAQASWSGSLKSKKKSELQQICRQLDIEYKSEALKADLEQQIRHRFQEVPSLQEDERFVRLDHTASPSASSNTSRRGTRARSVSRPPRANEEDQQSSAEDNRTRPVRSPSRRTTLDKNSTVPEPSGTQKILVTVVNTEKDLSRSADVYHTPSKTKTVATQPTIQAQQLAKQSGQQALESFNAFARYTVRQTIDLIQTIQKTFSCPWKLCVIAILAELTFVIYSTVPRRPANYVPPTLKPAEYRIPEPMIRLFHRIFSKSFLRPFLGYLGLTVIAPFALGGLMNVPSSSQEKDKQRFKATRDLKPSVFVYCATRLAVLSLVHLVFYPNYHFGWASQTLDPLIPLNPSPLTPFSKHLASNVQLHGFEYLQYVTTGFGMLIALHRLIRSPV